MQEKLLEFENRYQKYLIKKIIKFIILILVLLGLCLCFYYFLQKYESEKALKQRAQEEKIVLEKKMNEAKIALEKLNLSKNLKELEDLKKEEAALQEQNEQEIAPQKLQISSNLMSVANLKQAFYQKPNYEKAVLLAQLYLQKADYNRSIFWSLKANELDKSKAESWQLFASAKAKMGDENASKQALELYDNYYRILGENN